MQIVVGGCGLYQPKQYPVCDVQGSLTHWIWIVGISLPTTGCLF